MKYLIGIEIPDYYKANVTEIRKKYKYYSTEPHINIISPKALPNDDAFVTELIDICSNIKPFFVTTKEIKIYNNMLIYQSIQSKELIEIRKLFTNKLQLKINTSYEPYYTIFYKKFISQNKLLLIKNLSVKYLIPDNKYLVDNLIVYNKIKATGIYEPYIKINLE